MRSGIGVNDTYFFKTRPSSNFSISLPPLFLPSLVFLMLVSESFDSLVLHHFVLDVASLLVDPLVPFVTLLT